MGQQIQKNIKQKYSSLEFSFDFNIYHEITNNFIICHIEECIILTWKIAQKTGENLEITLNFVWAKEWEPCMYPLLLCGHDAHPYGIFTNFKMAA